MMLLPLKDHEIFRHLIALCKSSNNFSVGDEYLWDDTVSIMRKYNKIEGWESTSGQVAVIYLLPVGENTRIVVDKGIWLRNNPDNIEGQELFDEFSKRMKDYFEQVLLDIRHTHNIGDTNIQEEVKGKGGRPRHYEDIWAYVEVNVLGHDKAEVRSIWENMPEVKVRNLVDPDRSFRAAIKPRRKPGGNV